MSTMSKKEHVIRHYNKQPESILVVIYCSTTSKVLMLQRNDDVDFWQSVTGSLELGESPYDAALREINEEIGIDIISENLTLIDCHKQIEFEIYPQFLHRYAQGTTHNLEHWFRLPLTTERNITLTEHSAYCWLEPHQAAKLTKSWNNNMAITELTDITNVHL